MRNRTPNPTTSPTPSELQGFLITEKGLRACGAFTMEKAANRLREMSQQLRRTAPTAATELHNLASSLQKDAESLNQEMPSEDNPPATNLQANNPPLQSTNGRPQIIRYGTVCGRYRGARETRVSDLRLCGLWLNGAGFQIGQKYEVLVAKGKLTIRAVRSHPRSRRPTKTISSSSTQPVQ